MTNKDIYSQICDNINDNDLEVIEIARCKNCKYSRPLTEREKKDYVQGVVICENAEMSFDGYSARWIDDFCSYGERK